MSLLTRLVEPHLRRIHQGLFAPGSQVMLLVRLPGNDDADFMMGDLSPDDAIALIRRRVTDTTTVVTESTGAEP